MRVWVNTPDGWVQHGGERKSTSRAAIVAKLLATRCGWETASGPVPPPPRPAAPGAPIAAVAAVSPAPCSQGTSSPLLGRYSDEGFGLEADTGVSPISGAEEEPYLEEL